MNSYYDALIIAECEARGVFKHTPVYAAIQQATGWSNSHKAVGVDYADIAAEYIATMILGG